MLTKRMVFVVIAIGCGGSSADEQCRPQELPPTDVDGRPWPSFSDARAQFCAQVDGPARTEGSCADGKRFLDANGGFTGETLYFRNEVLVGRRAFTDVAFDDCGFTTSYGDVRCEGIDVVFELGCP
jgi:hypothetical protein